MKLDVIKLAKEAGDARLDPLGLGGIDVKWLDRFAALVIEECAAVLDNDDADLYDSEFHAAAIRAMKEPE